MVMIIGVSVSAVYYLVQMVRLPRWRQGRMDSCYVCTCLLGRERQGVGESIDVAWAAE